MESQNQMKDLPTIVPSFFFLNISVDLINTSKVGKTFPLIQTIGKQNGLNINKARQYNIALKILDKSVIRN